MNRLTLASRASAVSLRCRSASRLMDRASPLPPATAGRGRSVGSSSWSGSPASVVRQKSSWRETVLSGSLSPPSRACCHSVKSAYCTGSGCLRGALPDSRAV
ncbi:hypothetical protein SCMC78_32520 [Streptomyces sp. CMC78]|uniref:Secreted protein n=1 Tax=Streptomyces sp. CMC78 TaxID=3231512 RepID=A0AB33KL19_9ACTN